MAKLTEKEIQLRALREARQSSRGAKHPSRSSQPPERDNDGGLAAGNMQPMANGNRQSREANQDLRERPVPRKAASSGEGPLLAAGAAPKFDRNAYQREYMRKRRARQAEQRQKEKS